MVGKRSKFGPWFFVVGWILGLTLSYLLGFSLTTVYLLPIWGLALFGLNVPISVIFFALVGYTLANIRKLIKLTPEEIERFNELVENKKIVTMALAIVYIDALIVMVVGAKLALIASAGILIPLIWFSLEDWIIDKGYWFLTPSGLVAWLIFKVSNIEGEIPASYYLPGMPRVVKVQWSLQ